MRMCVCVCVSAESYPAEIYHDWKRSPMQGMNILELPRQNAANTTTVSSKESSAEQNSNSAKSTTD